MSAAAPSSESDRLVDRLKRAVIERVRAEIASGEARLAAGLALSFLLHVAIALSFMGTPVRGQGGTSAERVTVRVAPGPLTQPNTPVQVAEPRVAQRVPRASDAKRPAVAPVSAPVPEPAPPAATEPEALRATGPVPVAEAPVGVAAAGAIYLPASALDRRPLPEEEPALEHPPGAPFASGYVVLRILVNELGTVDGVEVLVSDPEGVFDAAATRAFSEVRYHPAQRNGLAVKAEMIVEVKFDAPLPAPGQTLVVTPPAGS